MTDDDAGARDEPPTYEELKQALRRLMTLGLPAARAEDVEGLLAMHAIRVLALVDLPSARVAALHERIHELTRGTRNETLRRLAPYAFGTYSVEDFPLRTRLEHAAQSGIGRGWEALRKTYLDQLAGDFADRLLWLEGRLRYNSWLDRPIDEALHDETLRQHDFYTATAFWLNGAALDLGAALELRAEDAGQSEAFAHSALWRWTMFLRFAHRHDAAFLGVYAMGRDADMKEAMRAEWDAQAVPPLTPVERSFLRVELLASFHEELAPYISTLEATEGGRTILKRWMDWVGSCACGSGEPEDACSVHRFLDEAETFYSLMNKEISESHWTDRAARFRTLPDIYES